MPVLLDLVLSVDSVGAAVRPRRPYFSGVFFVQLHVPLVVRSVDELNRALASIWLFLSYLLTAELTGEFSRRPVLSA